MGQTKDLRIRGSTPSTPSSSVTTLYANASGILHTVNENGTTYQVGAVWANSVAMLGQSIVGNGASGSVSGYLPITGPSGQLWAIPVFLRA